LNELLIRRSQVRALLGEPSIQSPVSNDWAFCIVLSVPAVLVHNLSDNNKWQLKGVGVSITLKNVRYFVAVAEMESISRAVQDLNVSQSVVTEAIRAWRMTWACSCLPATRVA
jgi:hypothetical protein